MRSRSDLERIKDFVDSSYKYLGNLLLVDTSGIYGETSDSLGYCYKYKSEDKTKTFYKITCSRIGIDRTDFKVLMHEYGHIYLAHLDETYGDIDSLILKTIQDHKPELVEGISQECKCSPEFADALLKRVIDDPTVNHSLHNIAMDMEVNSKVLSKEDIEEMEADITSIMPKTDEELLKYIIDHEQDPEKKKQIQDQLDKMQKESKIKLILPCRYKTSDGKPFEDELTYVEYIIQIVKNIPEFVKMLVSINNGGSGDTSEVTDQQMQDAFGGSCSEAMGNLDKMMESAGMSSSSNEAEEKKTESELKGTRDGSSGSDEKDSESDGSGKKDSSKDHGSDERDKADRKRELGEIKAGGTTGCGSGGSPDATRGINTHLDEVDTAIREVIKNVKHKVVKFNVQRDLLRKYNRGRNRTVISPTYLKKRADEVSPKIVFIIDISGSMNTELIDRILGTVASSLKKINGDLRYDIISWSTHLGEHIKDINPKKPITRISYGGGTRMAKGIRYFRENYGPDAIMVLISDFEDYLDEWHEEESKMSQYTMYAFNYGRNSYDKKFDYLKVRNFKSNGSRY